MRARILALAALLLAGGCATDGMIQAVCERIEARGTETLDACLGRIHAIRAQERANFAAGLERGLSRPVYVRHTHYVRRSRP